MLEFDIEKCTGCRRCETACAFYHTGRVSPRLARIKVMHMYETGVDGPVACVQCLEKPCLACPEAALSLGNDGQIVCSPTLCTLCGACQRACPIGAVEIFGDFVYICDFCGGLPRCVEACSEGAVSIRSDKGPALSLAAFTKESAGLNPGEKRRRFLQVQGKRLRGNWRKRHA